MGSIQLKEQEWSYLLNVIYRMNYARTLQELRSGVFTWVRPSIPFTKGLFYLATRENGKIIHYDPVTFNYDDALPALKGFSEGRYPNAWEELQFSLQSSVKRNSEIRDGSFYQTQLYHDLYAPFDIHHAMKTTLIHEDTLYGILVFFRPKIWEDFSLHDVYIMELLKDHLALKLSRLLAPLSMGAVSLPCLSQYELTKREAEVLELLMRQCGPAEICGRLFISDSTYRKHLHNIFQKVNVTSQVQLIQLIHSLMTR